MIRSFKHFALLLGMFGFFAVPGFFSSVDSTAGYTVNGAAGANTALCSTGTIYAPQSTCGLNITGNSATATNATNAGNASTANALASAPSICGSGQFFQGINSTGNPIGCATPFVVTRICVTESNGQSCYQQYPDGTIHQFGYVIVPANSGGTVSNTPITFGITFPSAVFLTVSLDGTAGSASPPDVLTALTSGTNNSGSTVYIRCATDIGGGGCSNIANNVRVPWIADGY